MCLPQGKDTTALINPGSSSTRQNHRHQSLITSFFGSSAKPLHARSSSINNNNDMLMAEHRMIQCLTRLEHAGLTTANINVFFSQIEYISSQLHGAGKVHENQPMKNKSMCFGDISHLSIYYNNVRCVTNKTNLSTKIDLSVYKVLCFTETWLNNKQSSSVTS